MALGARVTLDENIWSDQRFKVLAMLSGNPSESVRYEMIARCAALWSYCTQVGDDVVDESVLATFVNPDHFVKAGLGEHVGRGIRVKGADERIRWFQSYKERGRKGGLASKARRQQIARESSSATSSATSKATIQAVALFGEGSNIRPPSEHIVQDRRSEAYTRSSSATIQAPAKLESKQHIGSEKKDLTPPPPFPGGGSAGAERVSRSRPRRWYPPPGELLRGYEHYPRKQGKTRGLQKARTLVKSPKMLEQFLAACERMGQLWQGASLEYCPHFSTFVNQERWLDEELPSPETSERVESYPEF